MPQYTSNPGRRLLGRLIALCGWKLIGEFPDIPRAVFIAAPHSSLWDGVWGLLTKIAVGANISFMAKRELFFWPLGWFLRKLGGMPIERNSTQGVVEQMAVRLRESRQLWIGIAPEGTRKQVSKWRTGFWHIARAAEVPIVLAYFHYPERTIGIGPLFHTTDDMEADLRRLREFYAPWRGKYRNVG